MRQMRPIVIGSILLLALSILGCKRSSAPEGLLVSVFPQETVVSLRESDSGVVLLDTSAAIGNVSKVMLADEELLLWADKSVRAFDAVTGEFVRQYSMQGRAENEYVSLWDVWCDDESVSLYDFNSKKILRYSLSGNLLENVDLHDRDVPFQTLARLDDQVFVGRRVFGMEAIPELALFDETYRYVSDLGSGQLKSGVQLNYPFCGVEGKAGTVLYNPYFSHKIYEITRKTMRTKYSVHFVDRTSPDIEDFKDEYEILELLQKVGTDSTFAAMMTNLYESEKFFCFSFISSGKKLFEIYDKHAASSKTVYFRSDDGEVLDMIASQDRVLVLFQTNSHTGFKEFRLADLMGA